MAAKSVWESMVEAGFKVSESCGSDRCSKGTARKIGRNGMEVILDDIPSGRFAWLEFELPETGYRVKALGEVAGLTGGREPASVLFSFKHVFPHDRNAMDEFLSTRVAA